MKSKPKKKTKKNPGKTPVLTAKAAQKALRKHADAKSAQFLSGFFRSGKGEYAEGDRFLGIAVPVMREVAKHFRAMPLAEVKRLLASPLHEERAMALVILVERYKRADEKEKAAIYKLYMASTRFINNWDLVDLSAPAIVGGHLFDKDRSILYTFGKSTTLWKRRIAVVATLHLIRKNQFEEILKLSEMLLDDAHDLMHKAVGWMLREVGKRDLAVLEGFLDRYHRRMPRTALRYSLERMTPARKAHYMAR